MRAGKLFTGIFGGRKVQCYLNVQATILLNLYAKNEKLGAQIHRCARQGLKVMP